MKKSEIKPGAHLAYGRRCSATLGSLDLREVVVAQDQTHQGKPLVGRTRIEQSYRAYEIEPGRVAPAGVAVRIVPNTHLKGTWEQHLAAKAEREAQAADYRRLLDQDAAENNEAVRALCEAFGAPVVEGDGDFTYDIALPEWAQVLVDPAFPSRAKGEMTATDLKAFFDAAYQMGYLAAQMNYSTEG